MGLVVVRSPIQVCPGPPKPDGNARPFQGSKIGVLNPFPSFFLLYYIKNKILALLSSSSTDQPLPIGITVTGASLLRNNVRNVKSLREAGDV